MRRNGKFASLAGLLTLGVAAAPDAAQALDLSVFGDMSVTDSSTPGNYPSFRIGGFDLYALQYIDDKTKALFETQLQPFADQASQTVEVQRFYIMREVNDHFHIGLGRFHTPLGYWNTHYHHGILLQDTVDRPFFLMFEGNSPDAIWPIHMIGVQAEGEIVGSLKYEVAIANSNRLDSSRENARLAIPNRADLGDTKSVFARLHYDDYGRPFKPGIFFMHNDVRDFSATTSSGAALPVCSSPTPSATDQCSLVPRGRPLVKQILGGTDLRYELDRFQFLGEFYWLQNEAQPGVGDGRTHWAFAFFTQFGYSLTDNFKATYRYEALQFDDKPVDQGGDPYFMSPRLISRDQIGTNRRNVFCLRYDFSESNALMLEVFQAYPDLAPRVTTTTLSWAFVLY